ncbi:porin family protein [Ideonella sp. B7]|uniref:porin family protein n=1 Tax=Ideonella benzenivorans TaxID=2831643 RepID=UPI001CEC5F5F|nr:porin family protein [Ideonella benzenivorans]MCA6216779.1 porin family protein [Ideonella benzenivorans]
MKKFAVMAAAVLAMGAAHAETVSPLYGELGYTFVKVHGDGATFHPGVLRGLVGYDFHPYFAVEGMFGAGVNDDSIDVSGVSVKGEVEHTYGFYLKPKYQVSGAMTVFARLGFADSKIKVKVPGASASDSDSDFSYGAGLSYAISPKAYLSADYMSYYNKDGIKGDGFTLGVGYKF